MLGQRDNQRQRFTAAAKTTFSPGTQSDAQAREMLIAFWLECLADQG